MKAHRLDSMMQNAIGFDLETDRIQPGLLSPPPVLGSAAEMTWSEIDNRQWIKGKLLSCEDAYALFKQILDTPSVVLCVANGVFDILVKAVYGEKLGEDLMPKIFAMYDPEGTIVKGECDGRVFEIQLAEPLHAIAQGHLGKHALTGAQLMNKKTGRTGRYSLDNVTYEVLGREDAKVNDRFRSSYHQFRGVPLKDLPYEAQQYPVDDAINTVEDALAQAGHLPSVNVHQWAADRVPPYQLRCVHCNQVMAPELPQACMRKQRRRNLHDLARQAYFAWAAHLGAAWGFNVNQSMVDALEKKYTDSREANAAPFRAAGIVRENNTEDQSVLKRLVAVAYGARDLCLTCAGERRVPSPATNGKTKINCDACDGTGLHLPNTVPRSDKGGIKKDHDTLQESGDDILTSYGEQEGKKILSTYIPLLRGGRSCDVCGETGVSTKYRDAHKDWCTNAGDGATYRTIPLIVRVDPLKDTGRCAVEGGLHGLPRKGGVRECIEARKGYVLSSSDFVAGELVTVSWACLRLVGHSKLAEVLNRKLDAHLALAGTMLGKSYDEMLQLKKAHDPLATNNRQGAKNANFGYWGGMAELTFVLRKRSDKDLFTPCPNGPDTDPKGVRGYNGFRPCIVMGGQDRCGVVKITSYNDKPCVPVCKRCVENSKVLREFFFKQWLEAKPYFDVVKKLLKNPGPSGTSEITHLVSNRIRGGLEFCDGANGIFQGLLADAAKDAYCQIQRECADNTWRVRSSKMMPSRYEGVQSPLYGSRAIMLAHDETVAEHPEGIAHEAASRVGEIMTESLRWKCPEMYEAVQAPPALMRRLLKGAEPKYARSGTDKPADESDRLVCWDD